MNNNYIKAKDIFTQRRTSNNEGFEEYPLIVQPSSLLTTDSQNNLGFIAQNSFVVGSASYAATASHASIASFSVTASFATSASYEITYEQSSSYADVAAIANSISFIPSTSVSASWASSSISTSFASNSVTSSHASELENTCLSGLTSDVAVGASVTYATPSSSFTTNPFAIVRYKIGSYKTQNGHKYFSSLTTTVPVNPLSGSNTVQLTITPSTDPLIEGVCLLRSLDGSEYNRYVYIASASYSNGNNVWYDINNTSSSPTYPFANFNNAVETGFTNSSGSYCYLTLDGLTTDTNENVAVGNSLYVSNNVYADYIYSTASIANDVAYLSTCATSPNDNTLIDETTGILASSYSQNESVAINLYSYNIISGKRYYSPVVNNFRLIASNNNYLKISVALESGSIPSEGLRLVRNYNGAGYVEGFEITASGVYYDTNNSEVGADQIAWDAGILDPTEGFCYKSISPALSFDADKDVVVWRDLYVSRSMHGTASYANSASISQTSISASYSDFSLFSRSASYADTSSYSINITNVVTQSFFSASVAESASWASSSVSSSVSSTASFLLYQGHYNGSASYAFTSSHALRAGIATSANTATNANVALIANLAYNATSSISASWASSSISASWSPDNRIYFTRSWTPSINNIDFITLGTAYSNPGLYNLCIGLTTLAVGGIAESKFYIFNAPNPDTIENPINFAAGIWKTIYPIAGAYSPGPNPSYDLVELDVSGSAAGWSFRTRNKGSLTGGFTSYVNMFNLGRNDFRFTELNFSGSSSIIYGQNLDAWPTSFVNQSNNTCSIYGDLYVSRSIRFSQTGAAPLNTINVVAWHPIIINNQTYKVPLYQ